MTTRYPFLEVLHELMDKISEAQGVVRRGKQEYQLVKGLGQRMNRWFPEDPLVDRTSYMRSDDYDDLIRRRLMGERGQQGEIVLSGSDIDRLDRAYGDYVEYATRPVARVGEKVSPVFERMVKRHGLGKGDLDIIGLFRNLLAAEVMLPFWQGDKKEAYRNADAIRSGLLNGHASFKVPPEERMLWDDMALGVAGFCLLVDGGGFKNRYTLHLINRQEVDDRNNFRAQELLQLRHFVNPKNLASSVGLEALLDGHAGVYGALERGFMKVRAACSAIELGFKLEERPWFLEGYSVGGLMQEGLDQLGPTASLQSRLNCEAYILRALAFQGKVSEVCEGASRMRARCGREKMGPHLEAMLLLNETLAYEKAHARGCCRNELEGRVAELKRLTALNKVPTIWGFDLGHMERLNKKIILRPFDRVTVYSGGRKNC